MVLQKRNIERYVSANQYKHGWNDDDLVYHDASCMYNIDTTVHILTFRRTKCGNIYFYHNTSHISSGCPSTNVRDYSHFFHQSLIGWHFRWRFRCCKIQYSNNVDSSRTFYQSTYTCGILSNSKTKIRKYVDLKYMLICRKISDMCNVELFRYKE